ncbi:hypothetical protein ABDD95_23165 [Mucilaginibacter sp. PAMB04274]|uniref:hypothetical protein n=1 Tax=Mucilaginibacter sp. PAMB04274 TaxID=3138568 RepID=UPI0031F6FA5B
MPYQLDKVDLHDGSLQTPAAGHMVFAYQNNVLNSIITTAYFPGNAEPLPIVKLAYEYYANGDIKVQKEYMFNVLTEEFELAEMHTYEYDTKTNPLAALGEIYQVSFEIPSKHNPVKDTHTDKEGNLVQTTTYIYTYNSNGYPVQAEKKVTAPGQANPTVSLLKYTYQ